MGETDTGGGGTPTLEYTTWADTLLKSFHLHPADIPL
jgi:hypothetical protein